MTSESSYHDTVTSLEVTRYVQVFFQGVLMAAGGQFDGGVLFVFAGLGGHFDGDKTGDHRRADAPRQGHSDLSDSAPFQEPHLPKRRND